MHCGRVLDLARSSGDPTAIVTSQHANGGSNELDNLQPACRLDNVNDASRFVPLQARTREARMAAELERR